MLYCEYDYNTLCKEVYNDSFINCVGGTTMKQLN